MSRWKGEGRKKKDIPALLEAVSNMSHDVFEIASYLGANGNGSVAEGNERYAPLLGVVPHDVNDDGLPKDRSAGLSSVAMRCAAATCNEFSQKAALSYAAKVGMRVMTIRLTRVSRWLRRERILEAISL
jgi:hypothetical protein